MVGLDRLVYAGSHGFDIAGPDGSAIRHEVGTAIANAMLGAAMEEGRSALRRRAWQRRSNSPASVNCSARRCHTNKPFKSGWLTWSAA